MNKLGKIFLILVIFFALTVQPQAQAGTQAARIDPSAGALLSARPQEMVRVIVQASGSTETTAAEIARLGGSVVQDLHIIHALSANMTGAGALALSTSPAVRWVSLDGGVQGSAAPGKINTKNLPKNTYLDTLNVQSAWKQNLKGQGITVAVIDSGIAYDNDFRAKGKTGKTRILFQQGFGGPNKSPVDTTGHGTFVAGIIGGNGADSNGLYSGIAPMVNLIGLRISDEEGKAYESDAVAAMQWVFDNKDRYNIRVVNLSLNTTTEASYHSSPMDAAAEILWFNGIVVVVSSGNKGHGTYNTANAAPANDPFIITVGASDESGTPSRSDDTIAPFSAHGITEDGYRKPEIIAPGKRIISVLGSTSNWQTEHPDHVVVPSEYLWLSGTSMSAPMVAGAAAILLQKEPNLTPDQVKYRLITTGSPINAADQSDSKAAQQSNVQLSYLNVASALSTKTEDYANQGVTISQMLWQEDAPTVWDSVAWNSIAWNSVAWNSIAWNSLAWNSLAWNSLAWNSLAWNSTTWDK